MHNPKQLLTFIPSIHKIYICLPYQNAPCLGYSFCLPGSPIDYYMKEQDICIIKGAAVESLLIGIEKIQARYSFSGINKGASFIEHIFSSGIVCAALEARVRGIP